MCRIITNDVSCSYQQMYVVAHIICNHSIHEFVCVYARARTGTGESVHFSLEFLHKINCTEMPLLMTFL